MNPQGFMPRAPTGHPRFRPPRHTADIDAPNNFHGPPDGPHGRGFPRMMNPRGPPGPLPPRALMRPPNPRMPESLMTFPGPPDQFDARGTRPMGNLRGELRPERPHGGPLHIRGPRDPFLRQERPIIPPETNLRGRNPEIHGHRPPGPRFHAPPNLQTREQIDLEAENLDKPEKQFSRELHHGQKQAPARDGNRHASPDRHHSSRHLQSPGHLLPPERRHSPGRQRSPERKFMNERPVWSDGPRSGQDSKYRDSPAEDGRRYGRPLWDEDRRRDRAFDRQDFDRNRGNIQPRRPESKPRAPAEFNIDSHPPYFHGERDRPRDPQRPVSGM